MIFFMLPHEIEHIFVRCKQNMAVYCHSSFLVWEKNRLLFVFNREGIKSTSLSCAFKTYSDMASTLPHFHMVKKKNAKFFA